jgi:hypothetical protein
VNDFDRRLRDRLQPSSEPDLDAQAVLSSLRAPMARAHRRRQAAVGVTGTLMLVLVVGLGALAVGRGAPSEVRTASPPPPSIRTTLASDATVDSTAAGPAGESTGGDGTPATEGTVLGTSVTNTPTAPTTSPEQSAGSEAWTTAQKSTICGSVEVRHRDGVIELVAASPAAEGITPDIKNRGPETVEVAFEGQGRHCEVTASLRDGTVAFATHEDAEDHEGDSDHEGDESPGDRDENHEE